MNVAPVCELQICFCGEKLRMKETSCFTLNIGSIFTGIAKDPQQFLVFAFEHLSLLHTCVSGFVHLFRSGLLCDHPVCALSCVLLHSPCSVCYLGPKHVTLVWLSHFHDIGFQLPIRQVCFWCALFALEAQVRLNLPPARWKDM